MISNNYIPEKINEYNAYLDGTKMIGVAASVTQHKYILHALLLQFSEKFPQQAQLHRHGLALD